MRFLLADDAGAGKPIMAGLLVRESLPAGAPAKGNLVADAYLAALAVASGAS